MASTASAARASLSTARSFLSASKRARMAFRRGLLDELGDDALVEQQIRHRNKIDLEQAEGADEPGRERRYPVGGDGGFSQ